MLKLPQKQEAQQSTASKSGKRCLHFTLCLDLLQRLSIGRQPQRQQPAGYLASAKHTTALHITGFSQISGPTGNSFACKTKTQHMRHWQCAPPCCAVPVVAKDNTPAVAKDDQGGRPGPPHLADHDRFLLTPVSLALPCMLLQGLEAPCQVPGYITAGQLRLRQNREETFNSQHGHALKPRVGFFCRRQP